MQNFIFILFFLSMCIYLDELAEYQEQNCKRFAKRLVHRLLMWPWDMIFWKSVLSHPTHTSTHSNEWNEWMNVDFFSQSIKCIMQKVKKISNLPFRLKSQRCVWVCLCLMTTVIKTIPCDVREKRLKSILQLNAVAFFDCCLLFTRLKFRQWSSSWHRQHFWWKVTNNWFLFFTLWRLSSTTLSCECCLYVSLKNLCVELSPKLKLNW